MKKIKNFELIITIALLLNLVFLLYIAFFKKDIIDLEIMKAGWKENFKLVEKLYNNPSYISQQKESIQQWLDSLWIE